MNKEYKADPWLILILGVVCGALIIGGFIVIENKWDNEMEEAFQNGTAQGQVQIIQYIQSSGKIPYFLEDGNLSEITFTQLCEQLNYGGQS